MARKRLTDEPDNHDRWLISYADLMTTMFAFFVVLYAMSSVQEMKFQELSSSLGTALGNTIPPHPSSDTITNVPSLPEQTSTPLPTASPLTDPTLEQEPFSFETQGTDPEPQTSTAPVEEKPKLTDDDMLQQLEIKKEKSQMQAIATELEKRLAPLINQGKVHVNLSNWGISVELNASILFPAAEAKLNPESFETLRSIASILKDQPQSIHVAGHTDNKMIKTPSFPSNWELSSARAGSVVRLLIDAGIEPKRLAAIGFADNQPVDTNSTNEGRMRNRRVQLSIMAKSSEELESITQKDIIVE